MLSELVSLCQVLPLAWRDLPLPSHSLLSVDQLLVVVGSMDLMQTLGTP